MIVIPAIDLRAGACVQVSRASQTAGRLRFGDPVDVARTWVSLGFARLHVMDLDAADDHGNNALMVRDILAQSNAEVQVRGGVRGTATIERLLSDGAANVVAGSRAVEEPDWIEDEVSRHEGEMLVAVDVRDRRVITRGRSRTLTRHLMSVVEHLNDLPIAGVIVTAVHRDGRLGGTDMALMEDVVEATDHPVMAAGGISTMHELHSLENAGISAAIVGTALYSGTLSAQSVVEEFQE